MTRANDSEMYGADSFSNTTSIPRISLFDFFGWELRYFSIFLLDTLVERKVWILFEPFQNKSSDKFWNLKFILLSILAKCWLKSLAEMSQAMRECLFSFIVFRAGSRFEFSRWETSLQSNGVSYWLCVDLESALVILWLCFLLISGNIVISDGYQQTNFGDNHFPFITQGGLVPLLVVNNIS